MKHGKGKLSVQVAQVAAGLLMTGLAFAQTGIYKSLPDVTLSSTHRAATTPGVAALGSGTVKFILGKPEPSGAGCTRVRAEILEFTKPVKVADLNLCDSRSREVQTPHAGIAAYALRLTLLDQGTDRSVRFSGMRAFYPSIVQPLALNDPGTMQLAPGNTQSKHVTVPLAGRLMIRTKWSPSVRVYTSLQRPDGTTIHQGTGYDGVSTLTASVPGGGTYKIEVRNASTSLSAQVSIDRVEFTASSF